MNAQLIKIDVAADLLKKSMPEVMDMVDGGTLLVPGLAWVFNMARNLESRDRELRCWRPEVLAHAERRRIRFQFYQLDWVINRILPDKIFNFQAGHVDQMFQLRPRTRLDFDELHVRGGAGVPASLGSTTFYPRAILAEFLRARWIGARNSRPAANGGAGVPASRKTLLPAADVAASAVAPRPAREGNSAPSAPA